jgi:hypothetical protein
VSPAPQGSSQPSNGGARPLTCCLVWISRRRPGGTSGGPQPQAIAARGVNRPIRGRDVSKETRSACTKTSAYAALLVTAAVAAGCAILITLGEVAFGIAGLIVSGAILTLWRVGM